jgi:lipopolysaccharide transport system ATP-binding protein
VDEVLAVGDAAFQKKCLGKMGEVAREGRTVLFVSHDMAAVENLCNRGIVLQNGHMKYKGRQKKAIAHYQAGMSSEPASLHDRIDRLGSGEVRGVAFKVKDEDGNELDAARAGQTVDLCLYFKKYADVRIENVLVGFLIRTQLDVPVFLQHNRLTQDDFGALPESGVFVCRIRDLPLNAGTYGITYSIMPNNGIGGEYYDSVRDSTSLTVIEGDFFGSGVLPHRTHGVCLVKAHWRIEKGTASEREHTKTVTSSSEKGSQGPF